MATDLQEGLRRLAAEHPVAVPPGDLWDRGLRRRRRRRVAGTLAAAAAVLAVAASGVLVLQPRQAPAPASGHGQEGIPRRLGTPSPWTPGTGGAGPLGPLAVVAEAPRHITWFQSPPRPFGVSAGSGTYRFLDLPGYATENVIGNAFALSPDGRHVGYWIAGETPQHQSGLQGKPVVGFASYDTVTGAVTVHRVPTQRGVYAEAMTWVSPSVLLVTYGHLVRQPGTSHIDGTFLWTPATNRLREVPRRSGDTGIEIPRAAPGGFLGYGPASLVVWSLPSLRQRHYRIGVDIQDAVIDPTGTRVAIKSEAPGHVLLDVGRLPRRGSVVAPHPVLRPRRSVYDLLGWRDSSRLIAEVGYGLDGGVAVVSVDVHTGERTVIGHNGAAYYGYAADLWSRRLVSRPGPPWEIDPRMVAGGAGLLALYLVAGGVALRRSPEAR